MTKCIEISLCGFIVTGKYPVRSPHFQSTKDCPEFEGNPGNRGFQMMHKHKNNCFKVKLKGKQMIKGFVRLQHLQQIQNYIIN